jgi:hypothetical protein
VWLRFFSSHDLHFFVPVEFECPVFDEFSNASPHTALVYRLGTQLALAFVNDWFVAY